MKIENLSQVTEEVCQQMLGLHLTETSELASFDSALVASVTISGESDTELEVAACPRAADAIAAAMFATEPGQNTEEDVRDAVCEVANMIGGNIKGMFGGDNLSIPVFSHVATEPSESGLALSFSLADGRLQVYSNQYDTANVPINDKERR